MSALYCGVIYSTQTGEQATQ